MKLSLRLKSNCPALLIHTDEMMSLLLLAGQDGQFALEHERHAEVKTLEDVWNNPDNPSWNQLHCLENSAAFFVEECNGDREEYEVQRKLRQKKGINYLRSVKTDREAEILLECWLENEEDATTAAFKAAVKKKAPQRRGKWTKEEYEYAAMVIQMFNEGYLPAPAGT